MSRRVLMNYILCACNVVAEVYTQPAAVQILETYCYTVILVY